MHALAHTAHSVLMHCSQAKDLPFGASKGWTGCAAGAACCCSTVSVLRDVCIGKSRFVLKVGASWPAWRQARPQARLHAAGWESHLGSCRQAWLDE
jgi:hypothetical protein